MCAILPSFLPAGVLSCLVGCYSRLCLPSSPLLFLFFWVGAFFLATALLLELPPACDRTCFSTLLRQVSDLPLTLPCSIPALPLLPVHSAGCYILTSLWLHCCDLVTPNLFLPSAGGGA
jgi:hypothetical protein